MYICHADISISVMIIKDYSLEHNAAIIIDNLRLAEIKRIAQDTKLLLVYFYRINKPE